MISVRYFALGSPSDLVSSQRDRNVAAVLDVVAERLELALESGDAHRRWTHVDAAARLPEIERHADDADLLGFNVL